MFGKNAVGNKLAVLLAEFLGTGVLTYVFLSLQHSSIPVPYFVSIAVGLALAVVTFMFARVSGAHFNPAITLGLWSARKIKALVAVPYIVVQCFGAWVAYVLFNYLFAQPVQAFYQQQPAWDLKVVVAEAVGALVFSLGWAAALYRSRENNNAFAAFVGVAFAIAILVASVASVGLVNPAAAIGTRFFHIWSGAAWGTYVLGPVVGAVVGFNLYDVLFRRDPSAVTASSARSASTTSSTRKTTTTKKPAARKKTTKKR